MTETFAAGIDVGGTKCLAVLVDEQGNVVAETRVPTPVGSDHLLQMLCDVAGEFRDLAGEIACLGVGMPGLVTPDGRLRYAPNLIDIEELDVRGALKAELPPIPIIVDNDSNCAIWAEHLTGAAVGLSHAVLVTLGTGIGTGLIVNGRVEHGANGFAGELGHIIVDPQGVQCTCGRRGCYETVASGPGLARKARQVIEAGGAAGILTLAGGDPDNVKGEHVTRAARSGDDDAIALVEEYVGWVALGLANYTAVLDPELVLIGGGLVAESDLLLDQLRAAYDAIVMASGHRPLVPIQAAGLGERAGALGAALLARSASL